MKLRRALKNVLAALLEASAARGEVTLDEIGDALGVLAVSQDEIDALLAALEAAGRVIAGPSGGGGEQTLARVLACAREMRAEMGKAPSARQIAERLALPVERVHHALALARVIAK